MVSVHRLSDPSVQLRSAVGAVVAGTVVVGVVLNGCGFTNPVERSREMNGTGGDVPTEVLDAYEAIAGRPFPDDVEVLGYEYDFGWLDDRVRVVAETTADLAEELVSLEQDDQPMGSDLPPTVVVSDDRIDAALERRPIQRFQHHTTGGVSETTVMGDGDTVTVILEAFQL